jgi:hypothetical protein
MGPQTTRRTATKRLVQQQMLVMLEWAQRRLVKLGSGRFLTSNRAGRCFISQFATHYIVRRVR